MAKLNTTGVATLGTGLALLPILEGVMHLGPIGMFIGGAGTYVAYRHGAQIANASARFVDSVVDRPIATREREEFVPSSLPSRPIIPTRIRGDLPGGAELLSRGIVSENEILIGYDRDGMPVSRSWKQLKAIIIFGLQGGGKSSTAVWILAQVIAQGGRVAIIDKHGMSEEDSMMGKINAFEPFFACPAGINPTSAMAVVRNARQILDDRLDGGPCSYPFLLVVDEFSAIMRQGVDGGRWKEVARELGQVIEDFNTEGRKHKCFAICIGQIANASRTGGTTVRDLFNTRIVHRMNEKQANILCLNDQSREIAQLGPGETIIEIEGGDEPFFVRIPYLDDKSIHSLATQYRSQFVVEDIQNESEDMIPPSVPSLPDLPMIPEKGPKAKDVELSAAIMLWNHGYGSEDKLMKAFPGMTKYQAGLLRDRIVAEANE